MVKSSKKLGFTLIELVISLAIFAFMTAFLLSKYGSFNQGVLLTSLAYDVALTIRNAQSYGLNVKSAPTSGANFSTNYDYPYGVHFDKRSSPDSQHGGLNYNTEMIFYVDSNVDGNYDATSEDIKFYNIKRGSYISNICVGTDSSSCGTNPDSVDIFFNRPDPNAIIVANGNNYTYAEITLRSSDGGIRKVAVSRTGLIAILN